MRKLASIREIKEIYPIIKADAIEVAIVDGWECIVKKSDGFKAGDKVIYIEIDSIMPEKPEFEFLRAKKFRIKTIKLRGQISQGLVLPLSFLPDRKKPYELGDDVTEILGVKKYDSQKDQEAFDTSYKNSNKKMSKIQKFLMRFNWYKKRQLKKSPTAAFPDWIQKTDEERIQNLPRLYETWKKSGILFQGTEKLEGQSGTYFEIKANRKNKFGVCSRNVYLKMANNSSYWNIANNKNIKMLLTDLMKSYKATNIVLQGEIIGPNIQKNIYKLKEYDFYAYNLIIDGEKLSTNEIEDILSQYGINTVPVIYDYQPLPEKMQDLIELSKGKSVLNPEQDREGIVWRSKDGRISFKAINPDYLLSDIN